MMVVAVGALDLRSAHTCSSHELYRTKSGAHLRYHVLARHDKEYVVACSHLRWCQVTPRSSSDSRDDVADRCAQGYGGQAGVICIGTGKSVSLERRIFGYPHTERVSDHEGFF